VMPNKFKGHDGPPGTDRGYTCQEIKMMTRAIKDSQRAKYPKCTCSEDPSACRYRHTQTWRYERWMKGRKR